jgi:uncharacterized membrane protein YphA (DoxX/SURF4 family)
MLSVFPELLAFDVLAITILRVLVGMVLLYIGLLTVGARRVTLTTNLQVRGFTQSYHIHRFMPWVLGIVEIFTAVFIIVGFLTQIMVLVAAYLFLTMGMIEKHIGKVFDYPVIFNVVMIIVSLTLLLFGAGAYAIDVPL